jgi:hypothetical protein
MKIDIGSTYYVTYDVVRKETKQVVERNYYVHEVDDEDEDEDILDTNDHYAFLGKLGRVAGEISYIDDETQEVYITGIFKL